MGKRKNIRKAAKALLSKPPKPGTPNSTWLSNWLFDYQLIDELSDITDESEYPVDLESVESVLIALTKLK